MLRVDLHNETSAHISVPANFLDRSRGHELSLLVVSSEGDVQPMCDGIDYVHGPDTQVIAPGQSAGINVPISAVKIAYCLEKGVRYEARAFLNVVSPAAGEPILSGPVGFISD